MTGRKTHDQQIRIITPKDKLEENKVLSNRDKAQHSKERGLDSRQVATEQHQDHAANRLRD
ncbi:MULTISPECIES: hypothetical protein [unclassified Mesorhizobium]|uniref:hypothetical protein n=1 Tax=unclassified Mesorhizobium TaxID=325217 RepID=UPI000FCA5121|nr:MULTISPECIES: hypothetical protein [unclassified Mesorhizobium]RUU64563.1 hypothetical protein EOC99_11955 [Mesorhizobium sp. M7A.T.Ca.TU.009.01.1.1]RUU88410.1 hypothetical protein EOD03_04845 [Mesorhizobium sp. M7A.T.Ca.TU.009.01.1.2]RUT80775.1 hypothetical protein EOD14_32645 [Mesorhizobium sp. M7A.T.Ca.US.000.02.1.1]RUT90192.1 hypothetical protein EOD15_19980 [Mesorhizobium sp. M7A.T.Ca.US.000.02.2.1]RUU00756.1 hypothetical protein EOD12_18105 [Mesorhizobium sp. M7A.T.Ca.TU.009.02.1.1]